MSSPPALNRDSSWESTSSSKVTASSSSGNKPRSHHAPSRRLTAQPVPLKSLAAKPPSLPKRWQPLPTVNRSSVQKAAVPPRKLLICSVCGRSGCQLVSHRTFVSRPRKKDETTTVGSNLILVTDEVYKSSYAIRYGQAYVDSALAEGRIDPFHNLPLPSDLNTSHSHSLFHYYFSYECKQSIEAPKPAHTSDNPILDPFFVPAMQDPIVCLSVLALAAAQLPTNQGLPPDRVRSLEFSGRAMRKIREQAIKGDLPSDYSIIGHGFLWALSLFTMDKDAMQTYANSVHLLVRARGGLKQLGLQGFVEIFVRWLDARHGSIVHIATVYEDALEPKPLAQPPPRKYGSFWDGGRTAEILSQDVVNVCCSVCRIIEVVEDGFTNGMTTPSYMWVMGKVLHSAAARSRVLEMHKDTGSINECVALANELTSLFAVDNLIKQKIAVLCQAVPLVHALQKTAKHFPVFLARANGETELMMWLHFVAVMIPYDFEGKEWVSKQLRRLIRDTLVDVGDLPPGWTNQRFQGFEKFTWSSLKNRKLFDEACLKIREDVLLNPDCS